MPPNGGANEVIADLFTRHAVDLLRLEAGERRAIRRILADLERELVAQIARIDPTGVARETYRQRRLQTLLEQVRDTIRASYRKASSVLRGELIELADIEGEFVARAINDGVRFDLATANFTRAQLRALVDGVLVQGAPVAEWWSRQAGDTLQRFTDEMRAGIAQGQTNAQLIRRVRGGTQDGEQVVGFMSVTRRHADSLVRSATQAVAERAKQATYEENEDIIGAVVWTSTLDSRTTLQCMVRDGLRYRLKDKKPLGHDVPWLEGPGSLHWGCRSTSRPETKSWRDLGFDADDLPPQTRASMNGEVAADTTFEGWLSRRSQAEQDAALGAGRADLWRKGEITFRQLLDGNGRELSLAQLRERVGGVSTAPRREFAFASYRGVRNAAEAEAFIIQNGLAQTANLQGLSASGLSGSIGVAQEITERFGLQPLRYIGPISRQKYFRARQPSGAAAAVFPRANAMHLPTSFGRDARSQARAETRRQTSPRYTAERNAILERRDNIVQEVRDRVTRMGEADYGWTVGIDPEDIMAHEYGHVLHLIDERGGAAINEFLNSVRPTDPTSPNYGWQFLLSKYGGANTNEYIAESFTVYMRRPASDHYRIHPELLRIFRSLDLAYDN